MGLTLSEFLSPSEAARKVAADLRARHGPILWLAVGRCVYYKGYDIAIRALRHVPGKLLIIGQGPTQPALMQLARELKVEDRVVWSGYANRDELIGAYYAARALWFPSNARSEAFGLVQIEAMACGCPVINTTIPNSGVAWVCQNERTGLTVAVNDHAAFGHAASRLANDESLRQRLSAAARAITIERFNEHSMAVSTLSLYGEVLDSGHAFATLRPPDDDSSLAARFTRSTGSDVASMALETEAVF
jgi:rhamnosyl/mannosyltransferase